MRKSNKFDLIIDAASKIFITQGFEKSKMQDIAEKAGVGKGTIYEYFQSKEELFVETIKKGISYVYDDLMVIFDRASSMEDLIESYLQQSLYLIEEHSDKLKILFDDFPKAAHFHESHSWFIEKSQQLIDKLTNTVQCFMSNEEIRTVNAEVLALMILDILRLGFYYKIMKQEKDFEYKLQAQIDILKKGICS